MLRPTLRRASCAALLVLPLLLTACDSNEPPPDECLGTPADCLPSPATVFVGNQGNFTAGDGSVTVYDPESGEAAEPVRDLGSILQSIEVSEGRLYVAASTGGRVDVFDASGASRLGQVEVENPRYMAHDGQRGTLYVTSQRYDRPSAVVVVDAQTLEVIETVEVGGLAEGIVTLADRVFVATGSFGATQEVVVLDAGTHEIVQRIDVGCTAPRSLVKDLDGEVWVFCSGTPAFEDQPEVPGEVVVLDAATGEVVRRIEIDGRIDTAGPGQDAYAPPGATLLAVRDQDTVLRFNTATNALDATIPLDGDPIGAVAFEPIYDRMYVSRVPGFDVAGSVTIHDADGNQVGRFSTGAAPTSIRIDHTVAVP